MNLAQMVAVLLLLSTLIYFYAAALGFELTFMEALAGLAVLKGIAMFLTPEKPPMVLMQGAKKEEETE